MSHPDPTPVPSRVRRSQAERVALSDRRMIGAAIDLIVERGVHEMTLQAIGERAGYSRGLATHRFGSKAGLLTHVMRTASEDWLRRLQDAVGDRIGVDALTRCIDALHGFVTERPNEIRAMYTLWFQSIDPAAPFRVNMANVFKAQRADVVRWVRLGQRAGTVDPDADPARCAEQFCATVAGIVFQWIVDSRMSLAAMCEAFKGDIRARLEPRGAKSKNRKRGT